MELTRVTSGREQGANVTATGGDVDLLSLLLGGDDAASSAFPATLEAALAGGDTPADPIATAVDGEGGDAATGDDATSTTDGATPTDLAIAAALVATPGATAPIPVDATATGDGTSDGTSDATAVDATGTVVETVVASSVASATVAAAATATATAAATAAATTSGAAAVDPSIATTAAPIAAHITTTEHGDATVASPKIETAKGDAPKSEVADPTGAAPVHDTKQGTNAGDHAEQQVATAADAAQREPSHRSASSHADSPTARHGAGAGVDTEHDASFASGDGQHHGLDLGSSERHPAFAAAAGAPPAHAATSAGGTQAAQEVAVAPEASRDAVPPNATPTTNAVSATPASGHDAATTRTERALHHPPAIEPRWGDRVADAVRLSSVRGGGEIRLQLEPEGLGHIDVRLHLQADGVRAVIVAEHESTRALLTSQQQVLQDALQRSDVRLSGFSVDVGSGGGAAMSGSMDGRDQGGAPAGRPTAPAPPTTTADAGPVLDDAPLANGRVSVRV